MNQFRPKGDPSAAPYAPQRDLANIFLPMLREAFNGLDAKNWPPPFVEWFAIAGIKEDDLAEAVRLFMEAHRLFIREPRISSVADAFTCAGFTELLSPVKYALFARIGEVLTAGFFIAVRDVTIQGKESPVHTDMAAMLAAGRALAMRIGGPLGDYTHTPQAELEAANQEHVRLINQLQRLNEADQQAIRAQQQLINEIQQSLAGFEAERTLMIQANAGINPVRDIVMKAKKSNWFARFWLALYAAYKVYRTPKL